MSEDGSSRAAVPAQPAPTSGVPSATSTAPMLEIEDISVYYGNIAAVKGVSLTVMQGEVVTLIGSNGAGKSTTLRTISGLLRPRHGTIRFNGKVIDRTPPDQIVRLGIAQSPEGRRIFPRMTVAENLDLGAFLRKDKQGIADDQERMLELFPRLRERIGQKAGTLSGGEQQMLAIGRALVARPRLLLFDEPSLGLAPKIVSQIFLTLRELKNEGKTILLVEQNARQALRVADHGYVLERGRIIYSGSGEELLNMPEVQRTYLGQSAA